MIGTVVGSYRVTGTIGGGGMGMIYRAEHMLIGKAAAVKVLLPDFARNREIVNRFFNEAKAATAIQHAGIVEIFDFGYLPDSSAFIVMEFLPGESLASRIRARGRVSEAEAYAIVRGICSALSAAHGKGIVHRDIKPDNVFLVPDPEMPSGERVKLLDFGIAKLTDESTGNWSQTRTGAVLGTPTYMAPEQCRGAGNVDHRADLYAVGCILFELLAGRPPFVGDGAGEIIGAHQFVPAPTLRTYAPEASHAAEHLVAHLLAKNPDERLQQASEVMRAIGGRGTASSTGGHSHVVVSSAGVIGGQPTTLGGTASQMMSGVGPAAPRKRGVMIGVAAATVVAGIVAIAVIAGASKGGEEAGGAVAPAVTAPAPAPAPAAAPVVEPPPAPALAVEPPPPAPPPMVDAGAAPVVAVETPPAASKAATTRKPRTEKPRPATTTPSRPAAPKTQVVEDL